MMSEISVLMSLTLNCITQWSDKSNKRNESAIFLNQLPTFHAPRKVLSLFASEFTTLVSLVLGMKGCNSQWH